MAKCIIITGTPCTGKTRMAEKLSLLFKKRLICATQFAKNHSLFEDFDEKSGSYEVDPKKLSKKLSEEVRRSKDIVIVEGHMSHFIPKKDVILCIVCRTSLKTLRRRLKKRGYSEEKVKENLEAEIFEICLQEALELGHSPLEIDTTSPKKGLAQAKKAILASLKA